MIHQQNVKYQNVTPPAAKVNGGSFTCAEIDTLGWKYLTLLTIFGDIDADMTALKIGESDTAGGGAGYDDIVGTRFGTDAAISGSTSTLPTAAGYDNDIVAHQVNLLGHKRYLKPVATAGAGVAGTFATIIAVLSRGEEAPNTAAEAGATEILRV